MTVEPHLRIGDVGSHWTDPFHTICRLHIHTSESATQTGARKYSEYYASSLDKPIVI
jgi:hypothetical protein